MVSTTGSTLATDVDTSRHVVSSLRAALEDGAEWPISLLEAVAAWSVAEESYRGRKYKYFIGGEAFDWLMLAERLCLATKGLLPAAEVEDLLFRGRFPRNSIDSAFFKSTLGIEKYRAHLNYYYGVTVEEALQLSVELEAHKRHSSGGVHYRDDYSDEAFGRIYRAPRSKLLRRFRDETGLATRRYLSLGDSKEFTYWLFKHRLEVSDKARVASDTRKGLDMLQRMKSAQRRASR